MTAGIGSLARAGIGAVSGLTGIFASSAAEDAIGAGSKGWTGGYFGSGKDALAAAESGPMRAALLVGTNAGHMVVTNPLGYDRFLVLDPWVLDPWDGGSAYEVGSQWIEHYVEGGTFPMSLRLMGLHLDNGGAVIAELESGTPRGHVRVKFNLDQSGEVVVASPERDIFTEFATSVDEIRRMTSAVIAFSKASELRIAEGPKGLSS